MFNGVRVITSNGIFKCKHTANIILLSLPPVKVKNNLLFRAIEKFIKKYFLRHFKSWTG